MYKERYRRSMRQWHLWLISGIMLLLLFVLLVIMQTMNGNKQAADYSDNKISNTTNQNASLEYIEEMLSEIKEETKLYTDNRIADLGSGSGSSITYAGESPYAWFFANCNESAKKIYNRLYNSAIVMNCLEESEYSLMREGDVFQHDATICYYNSAVYCFYVNNQTDTADSAGSINAYVRLDKLNINESTADITNTAASIDVCKYGDTVDGLTITSGAGVPNMVLVDDVLYLLWSSKCSDGNWYEMYCTYDCTDGTLGTPHICKLGDGPFTCSSLAANIGKTTNEMISINASIAHLDGYYYACVCSGQDFPNGIIIRSADMINWEFVSEPQFEGFESTASFEGAMGAFDGNLYLALRQTTKDTSHLVNPMVLAKLDTSGKVLEYVLLPGTTSRPSFFYRGTKEMYLICPTENRTNAMCLRVYPALKNTYPVFDFCRGGNYTQCCAKSISVFYTVRTNGTTGLRVGQFREAFGGHDIGDLVS